MQADSIVPKAVVVYGLGDTAVTKAAITWCRPVFIVTNQHSKFISTSFVFNAS
jgi:hypothetical protein